MFAPVEPAHLRLSRFAAGLENFTHYYAHAVDAWALYDNTGELPELLDWSAP